MKSKKTKEDITQFKYDQLYKRLISNARAIIANQIVLALGVSKMLNLLSYMRDYKPFENNMKVFSDYYNETKGIPLGTERLYWNIEALKQIDKRLRDLDELHKDEILEKCYELVKKYEAENKLNEDMIN